MRESIRHFVDIVARSLPVVEPIYEFGSLQVPSQKGFADLRGFFPGKEYIGCDMREGPGVDLILDLHDVELSSESVGTVLMLDTLEHVECPRTALQEVHRILKPNGLLVLSSVMNFPIHNYPYDYWRFTPAAFRSLLKQFSCIHVAASGEESFPHTVVGVGLKSEKVELDTLRSELQDWRRKWEDPLGRRWIKWVKPFAPPVLYHPYSMILKCSNWLSSDRSGKLTRT